MCFFKCGSIVFERVYVVWAFLHMYIQGFCDVCVCVGIQTVVMVHVSVQCTVYLCVCLNKFDGMCVFDVSVVYF